ncbi:MAG: glutathione S-transferase [Proteobacteria bacterium]|nr:glutathione S-transferase [Pseudomonadota bacterium]
MAKSVLRIFSYLPNPRVWKALIAADYLGVAVEVIGDKPKNLGNWLWDFDARELQAEEKTDDSPYARVSRRGFSGTLYKTDAFMRTQPYGTVPAAFSADGTIGIFESNSILRAVARATDDCIGLYGHSPMQASRIDSFLDATLVFGREAQVYLLGVEAVTQELHTRMAAAFEFFLEGIERALEHQAYLAGEHVTLADIAFACDLSQFLRERLMRAGLDAAGLPLVSDNAEQRFPRAFAHLFALIEKPHFASYLGKYTEHFRA